MKIKQNGMVGCKYYKYNEDGSIKILRLKRIKNSDTFAMLDEITNDVTNLSKKELDTFIKLNPNGYLSAATVLLDGGVKDVIVSLHKKTDMDNGDNKPFCVCRQSIFDVFTDQINNNKDINFVGISINKDNCPVNVPFDITMACNEILDINTFGVYLTDTFEDLFKFINEINYVNIFLDVYDKIDHTKVKGYCKNLRQLMKENNFMYDFLLAFNITQLDFEVKFNEDNTLVIEQITSIEDIIKREMIATCVIPFDMDIDLKDIKRDHIMVSDRNEKIYVIAYDPGAPINRKYEALDDKTDKKLMQHLAIKS